MAGSLEFIKSVSASGVSILDATNVFSDKYDVYKLVLDEYDNTSANSNGQIRLLDSGGTVISSAEYDHARQNIRAYGSFTEVRGTNTTFMGYYSFGSTGVAVGDGIALYIFNPYNSSSYTFIASQGSGFSSGNGGFGYKGISVHKSAEQISGIRLQADTGTVDLAYSVYGVK
jgi:hypothetical protein